MARPLSTRLFTLLQRELREYRLSLLWMPVLIALLLGVVLLVSVAAINQFSPLGDAIVDVIQQGVPDYVAPANGRRIERLNPVLNLLHSLMLLVLLITTTNYLLGSLFNDRRDRSILFWRSLPVSEWETVLSKLAIALVIAPGIVIAISLLLQTAFVFLAMLLVWRLELQPADIVLANVAVGQLVVDQVAGWILTALLIAPACAWLLLASAAARRSPFMLAFAPLLMATIAEPLLFGSTFTADAIQRHTPHLVEDGSTVGFYLFGPDWSNVDPLSMLAGLLCTAILLYGTVYLRRYRWEI